MELPEENDHFNFGFFDEFLDVPEEESNSRKVGRMATEKEIDALNAHIGAFHKWSFLPDECKKTVVEFLDFKTRQLLGFCSKYDNRLTNSIPFNVHSLEILDNEQWHFQLERTPFENVIVRVQFDKDFNSGKRIEMIFSKLGEDTQMRWMNVFKNKRPEPRCVLWKNCNYYEKAVKFAEKWLKRCNYGVSEITVEMEKYPMSISLLRSLPKCQKLRISGDKEEVFSWWFSKVPEKLSGLQLLTPEGIRSHFSISSELLSCSQVMDAKSIYFWCRAKFSDEQFLKLKAKKISFDSVDITDEGINAFLKKWVAGEGVPDFKEALIWSNRVVDQDRVIRDLQVRPWDEAFDREARGFCQDYDRVCGRGRCYQISSKIEPFESLTLCFGSDRVSISATGKKGHSNGETYTYYHIPI